MKRLINSMMIHWSGAVGKWQLSFSHVLVLLFSSAAFISIDTFVLAGISSFTELADFYSPLQAAPLLLWASVCLAYKTRCFLSCFPSSFMICGPQLTLCGNQVIREVHIL